MLKKRNAYPLELILTGIELLKTCRLDQARPLVLYCFHVEKNKFLPLNRNYKPLGMLHSEPWAEYEEYDFLLIERELVNVEWLHNNAPDFNDKLESYFFFSDSTTPYHNAKNRQRYYDIIEKTFKFI